MFKKKLLLIICIVILVLPIVNAELGYSDPSLPKLEREDVIITSGNITIINTGGGNFTPTQFQDAFDNNMSGAINTTQMTYTDKILNILPSWLKSLFYTKAEVNSRDDDKLNKTDQRYNESGIIYDNNNSWLSTFNATYNANSGGNGSWNQSFADTLYADIIWVSNQSDGATNSSYLLSSLFSITNSSYLTEGDGATNSSYMTSITNSSYMTSITNSSYLTEGDGATNSSYVKTVGDTMTGDLNMSTNTIHMIDNHNHSLDLKKTAHELLHIVDDSQVHPSNLTISSTGGVVTAQIRNAQYTGHNVGYYVDHVNYRIVVGTGDDNVTLTQGTWESPETNYIYMDEDQELKASTTMPTGEFAWAGIVEVANASGNSVEYYASQDEIPNMYELVVNTYERAWYDNPIYETGMAITFENGNISVASGTMKFALTSVQISEKNVSDDTIYIWVSDPDSNFHHLNSLDDVAKYQDGGAIGNNKYFNVVIWGLVEDETNEEHIYINVQDEPPIEYNSVSGAESDVGAKTNYACPSQFSRTCYRIARIILKRTGGTNNIQTLSNGLVYKQLLDEDLVVFGGTSSVALGLDEVVANNPNTDKNIISTANITVNWFHGFLNWSYIQNVPNYVISSVIQGWIGGNKTATDNNIISNKTEIDNIISEVNTSANIESLNFVQGSHTIDTSASVDCSGDEVLLGNGSCQSSSDFGGGGDSVWQSNHTAIFNDTAELYVGGGKVVSYDRIIVGKNVTMKAIW